MELKPYNSKVKSILVQQLKECGWVDLIRFPIQEADGITPKEIQEIIQEIHKLFYNGDKVELEIQGVKVCVKINNSETFRVCASTLSTQFIE